VSNQDLRKQIDNIVQQIVVKYKPERVYVFGSMARNEFTEDSDLDLLIIKEDVPRNGIERRWQLRKMIEKHNLPVDFLVIKRTEYEKKLRAEDPFLKTILEEGKILYQI
jgi:predicted nucleotidyltransferase